MSISNTNFSTYQLVTIAIDLVHSVRGMQDCNPELDKNPHYKKASELANKWNELFLQMYVTREGK